MPELAQLSAGISESTFNADEGRTPGGQREALANAQELVRGRKGGRKRCQSPGRRPCARGQRPGSRGRRARAAVRRTKALSLCLGQHFQGAGPATLSTLCHPKRHQSGFALGFGMTPLEVIKPVHRPGGPLHRPRLVGCVISAHVPRAGMVRAVILDGSPLKLIVCPSVLLATLGTQWLEEKAEYVAFERQCL